MTENTAIEAEISSVHANVDRIEKVVSKLGDNDTKLITLCAELKTMADIQTKRMDRMESEQIQHRNQMDIDKSEFSRSVERIHDKIEASEEKNEDKIDYAVEKLGKKIDDLCDRSGQRIDKLTDRLDKFDKFKWIIIGGALVIGGLFTKFEVLKLLFSVGG